MLEKPDLPDETILTSLRQEYGLHDARLEFLPLGADVNTAVYRVVAADRSAYFLKLRKGNFAEITVTLPLFLKDQGIQPVITPLETQARRHWACLGDYTLILYPFIEGKDGYECKLTDHQWIDFGAALKALHTLPLPPLAVPRESFPPDGRELVAAFQAQAEQTAFIDPTAAKLAAFMKAHRAEITHLVQRAGQLADLLQSRPIEWVLCHADIHPGNLLITADEAFYIVDWDAPILAPKERDLMFIGGTDLWNGFREKDLFYQGYGPVANRPGRPGLLPLRTHCPGHRRVLQAAVPQRPGRG